MISLVTGMTVRDISENAIANLEYESIRHIAPTFHGDTLYAESDILEVTPSKTKADRGVVYVETRGVNQRGEVVLTLRRRVLVARRPAADAGLGGGVTQKKSKKFSRRGKKH